MRVGVYLRISKDQTGEALGVERQRQDCLAYAQARNWTVTHCYTDNDVSATKTAARPEFEAMLAEVKAGHIDIILSFHLDRLLRKLSELERVFNICQEAGTSIVTVADGVDTSSDGGRLVARILASVAQGEVERKGARQRRAMLQRAQQGKGWGARAFGYKKGDSLNRKESAAIRRGYTDILAGKSLYEVARTWNRAGLTTTKGNPWRGHTVKLVLCNPRYAALRSHKGEIIGPAQWPPVIDLDTWQAVHSILTDPQRTEKFTADRSRRFLLTGLLTCSECGSRLAVAGRTEARNYVCKGMDCYRVSRRVEQIDTIVSDVIKARLSRPDAADLFIRPDSDVRGLYEQLRLKRHKLDQIALDYADDALTPQQAKTASKRINAQIDAIEAEITEKSRSQEFSDFQPDDPGGWFDALPLERRRALIGTLCTVIIHPVGKGWRGGAGYRGVEIKWRQVKK